MGADVDARGDTDLGGGVLAINSKDPSTSFYRHVCVRVCFFFNLIEIRCIPKRDLSLSLSVFGLMYREMFRSFSIQGVSKKMRKGHTDPNFVRSDC